MNPSTTRMCAVALLVATAVLAFIAVERYQDRQSERQARREHPIGALVEDVVGQPESSGVPTATKYCGFFAFLSAIAGAVLFTKSRGSTPPPINPPRDSA